MTEESPTIRPLEAAANERNLAHYARDALGRALSIANITGPHAIDITPRNTIKLTLTAHEAQHLANTLEEALSD